MRTFLQKPKAPQETVASKSSRFGSTLSRQHRDVRSIQEFQRTVGNQAVQRSLRADSENDEVEFSTTTAAGLAYDFSQIPLYSADRGGENPRCESTTMVTLRKRGRAEVSDGFQDGAPESQRSPQSPLANVPTATRISCLQLVSFTVTTRAPRVSNASGSCRLELGYCSTPRGSCGASADSGATFTAVVRAGTGCLGELRFAQNVTSSERRRTLTGGSEECLSATGAHKDGGIPWKGCTETVTATGDHSITSDDCPSIRLASLDAAQASERFKTFLLWRAVGGTTSIPIANVQWGWQASTRRTGTSGTCASDWSAPGGVGATFRGAASRDAPVMTPDIRSVRYRPCAPVPKSRSEPGSTKENNPN